MARVTSSGTRAERRVVEPDLRRPR